MSKEIKIQDKQTLLDIAVQQYGNVDGVFDILSRNKDFGFDNQLSSGELIICDESNNIKVPYLSSKNIATDASNEISTIEWILNNGCWNDENYWIDVRTWIDICERWLLESDTWDDGKIWDDKGIWNN